MTQEDIFCVHENAHRIKMFRIFNSEQYAAVAYDISCGGDDEGAKPTMGKKN